MPKVIRCPSCQARYQIADEMMGRKFKCSKCGQALQLGPAFSAQSPQSKQAEAPQPALAAQGRTQQSATTRSSTVCSLLDEELAIEAAKIEAAAAAAREAELDAELFGEKAAEVAKTKCPHCDYEITVEDTYCPACGLSVQARSASQGDSKKKTPEWVQGVAAIILAMVLAPLMFWGIQMVLGTLVAMLITAVTINVTISLGSFAVACQIFHQKPPEFGEIYRVLIWSSLPNLILNWVGSTGLTSMLVAMALSILISALLCVAMLEFPFIKAIGICIAYNILATILALVGILLLVAIFVTTALDAPPPANPAEPPAAAPGENPMPGAGANPAPAPGENPTPGENPGQPQARARDTIDPALALRWREACPA